MRRTLKRVGGRTVPAVDFTVCLICRWAPRADLTRCASCRAGHPVPTLGAALRAFYDRPRADWPRAWRAAWREAARA